MGITRCCTPATTSSSRTAPSRSRTSSATSHTSRRAKEASERRYPHGEIVCELEIYERAVELNFIFGKGEGVAVGIDPYAFVGDRSFIGECLEILALNEGIDGREDP